MPKTTVNSRSAQIHAQDERFWNQVVAGKGSNQGYKYAYEMAKNHYHGGGSSWASGAGAKARSAYNEWQKADQARKEAERHAKAVGVAQNQAKVKLLGDLERIKLEKQNEVISQSEKNRILQEQKLQAKRARAQAQFGMTTSPKRRRATQVKRSSSPKKRAPKRAKRAPTFDDSLRHLY